MIGALKGSKRQGERQHDGRLGVAPSGIGFINCALVTVDLPAPARLLLMGQVTGRSVDPGFPNRLATGLCRIGSTNGVFGDTTVHLSTDHYATASPVAVTAVMPPGRHSSGIDCNESIDIRYEEAGIVAVALSPG